MGNLGDRNESCMSEPFLPVTSLWTAKYVRFCGLDSGESRRTTTTAPHNTTTAGSHLLRRRLRFSFSRHKERDIDPSSRVVVAFWPADIWFGPSTPAISRRPRHYGCQPVSPVALPPCQQTSSPRPKLMGGAMEPSCKGKFQRHPVPQFPPAPRPIPLFSIPHSVTAFQPCAVGQRRSLFCATPPPEMSN